MQPGTPQLVTCPHCGKEKKLMTLLSGNTIGARQWSDSKRYAPMLPRISNVQRCPHCGLFFLYPEAQKRYDDSKKKFNFCLDTGSLTYPEMKQAFLMLEESVKSKDSEKALRIAFLHSFNEAFRVYEKASWDEDEGPADHKQRSETDYSLHRSNLQAIITALDVTNPDNIPFAAELYRELGRFDDCIALLDNFKTDNKNLQAIVNNIREKALIKNDKVFEI